MHVCRNTYIYIYICIHILYIYIHILYIYTYIICMYVVIRIYIYIYICALYIFLDGTYLLQYRPEYHDNNHILCRVVVHVNLMKATYGQPR